MSGDVVPFRRRGTQKPVAPPLAEQALHRRTQRARPEARRLVAEQSAPDRQAYSEAAIRQRDEKLIASGRVVAARITLAMNLATFPDGSPLEGTEVDIACGTWEGNPAGDVDGWELAEAAPTREQVGRMATLTGFPVVWFYKPMKPGPLVGRDGEPGFIFMCGPGGCSIVKSDWVDERGVLHYGADPDDERLPREAVQGAFPIPAGTQLKKTDKQLKKTDKQLKITTPSRKKTAAARKNTPVVQQTLPTSGRMPDELRAELDAKLAAARTKRR